MNADQIRKTWAFDPHEHLPADARLPLGRGNFDLEQIRVLAEIAAQLADLNAVFREQIAKEEEKYNL